MVGDLQPDLLVLDLMLPRLHGLDLLRRIRTDSPKTKGIVCSMHDDERYVMEALRCGAWGCVLKGGTAADLVNAVRDVLAGRRYLPPERAGKVSAAEFRTAAAAICTRSTQLTKRERLVLQLARWATRARRLRPRRDYAIGGAPPSRRRTV